MLHDMHQTLYKDLEQGDHNFFKGNMHHKYDVSSKDAFCINDLAAEVFFGNFASSWD